jgi:putative hydrolase of the HAD superfamily
MEELFFGGENGHRAQRGEISAAEQRAYVCRILGLPTDPESGMAFEREFFGGDQLDQHLLDYIKDLHQHYKTGIISNAFDNVRPIALERWGMGQVFDGMVFSAEVGIMKPDRRIFDLSLAQLDVPASAAVFIDDFAHNVAGARAVGMQAIHFHSREQVINDLQALLEGA